MRHAAFRDILLLAKNGVPWNIALHWSAARRAAALSILREEDDGLS